MKLIKDGPFGDRLFSFSCREVLRTALSQTSLNKLVDNESGGFGERLPWDHFSSNLDRRDSVALTD